MTISPLPQIDILPVHTQEDAHTMTYDRQYWRYTFAAHAISGICILIGENENLTPSQMVSVIGKRAVEVADSTLEALEKDNV